MGTSAPSARPMRESSASSSESPHTSSSAPSAAAASLEPPPMPEATGRFFSSAIETGGVASLL